MVETLHYTTLHYTTHIRLIARIRALSWLDSAGPLDSALTITAQATVFSNWSSIWELPPKPFDADGAQLRGEATVSLTLVPYGEQSYWPLTIVA
eukprot:COSAG02_NODE_1435_length_12610_cov_7.021181_9_plen_94_part_00